MFPFILCSCGRAIGDLYDLFKVLRLRAYKAAGVDADPTLAPINESTKVHLGDILDQLGLHTDCCRARMITQVEFKTYY